MPPRTKKWQKLNLNEATGQDHGLGNAVQDGGGAKAGLGGGNTIGKVREEQEVLEEGEEQGEEAEEKKEDEKGQLESERQDWEEEEDEEEFEGYESYEINHTQRAKNPPQSYWSRGRQVSQRARR